MERRRTWLLAIVVMIMLVACNTALALTPDGLALLAFKSGLTTTSPLLETWNASDVSPCAWSGIRCTASGDVQSIILPSQVPLLEGNIAASLGKLQALEVVRLEGNLLSGGIPGELGNLGKLRRLSLSNLRLVGEVPLQLGNCSSLVELQLDGNLLTGDITRVLEELSKLPAIQQIRLDGNVMFTGTLPPSIGNATTLTYFSISGGLEGEIPKEMGRLVNMTTLSLKANRLNGTIPSWLGNMAKLATLELTGNSFVREIPPELGFMSSLKTLGLAENKLSGSIPRSLGNLVNLVTLELYTNSLSGPIPDTFTSLGSLRVLNLANNNLTGPFPGNMSEYMEGVYLQKNSLSGPIPEISMPNLTFFDVANNFFVGMLPDGLCQGGRLQELTVSGNAFEGGIPVNCARSLVRARLSDNRFTSLPDGFGKNSSLEYIDVSNNNLTGPLQAGLGTGSQVKFMDLSGNRLTGNLSVLQFSRNLSVLNLARNKFSGEIPASMAMCKLLSRVDLSYNALSGAVPAALANMSRLQVLHLQGNNLSRLDPRVYLSWSTTLRILNLAENPWKAPIASEVGALNNLQLLNLSHGDFRGPIPSALGRLTLLEVLDLSHNSLAGEIPCALGKLMTSLFWVDVSFNRLAGSLPQEWVKFLQSFPDAFKGNPGLCLQYDVNSLCVRGVPNDSNGSKTSLSTGVTVGVVFGLALAFGILVGLLLCWRRYARIDNRSYSIPAPKVDRVIKNLTVAPLSFTFDSIMAATKNLSDEYIIGRGYHGVVYKATLAEDTHIVVKRIVSVDMRTALVHKSFWKEIETLGHAKHLNLVRLLGFMQWGEVGFLLYDYVSNGDLRAALHDRERGLNLNWKNRIRIAEGVAQGLTYLHHSCSPPIVHRDITSSNVLLDDDLEPLISDFGLSKVLQGIEPRSQQWSTTSPAVLGTYGYIAPEVGYSTVVSTKLDVYSFGVLLLELLTGKQPAGDASFGDTLHVAAWARDHVRRNDGKATQSMLDASLLVDAEDGAVEEMLRVQAIALLCARENPAERPAMKEVVEMFQDISKERRVVMMSTASKECEHC